MPQLLLTYDLDTQTVTDARVDGRTLAGVSCVALANGLASVRDSQGRDLLLDRPATDEMSPADRAKAQLDVARAFGFKAGEGYSS